MASDTIRQEAPTAAAINASTQAPLRFLPAYMMDRASCMRALLRIGLPSPRALPLVSHIRTSCLFREAIRFLWIAPYPVQADTYLLQSEADAALQLLDLIKRKPGELSDLHERDGPIPDHAFRYIHGSIPCSGLNALSTSILIKPLKYV